MNCDHRATTTSTEKWWDIHRDEYFDIDVVTCTNCGTELSRSGPR
jgi:hypothetical protein